MGAKRKKMIHELKTHPEYFQRILTGDKTFEVRKNDRDFQTGDVVLLREYYPDADTYSGMEVELKIIYILNGGQFGIKKGYCVMGLSQAKQQKTF